MPMVTIVVPNYNYGHFIREAIASVIAQTFTDWELIVVDDHSTDGSREIVEDSIRRYSERRITLLHNEVGPSGTPTPINIGIRHMRGEYFAWLSSDDVFEPTKLARQIAALQVSPSLGMVHTAYVRIDDDGRETGSFHPPSEFEADVFTALIDGNFVNGNTVLIRRDVLDAIGPFLETDPDCHELWRAAEYYYWLAIASRYAIVSIDEPLHRSRMHAGNRDINLDTMFPALERMMIHRFLDRERVDATPELVRALGGRGLLSLAFRILQELRPESRSRALALLADLEQGQDGWDIGDYQAVRDLDKNRLRAAFHGGSSAMLETVSRLERREYAPYRDAARRRLENARRPSAVEP